MLVVEPNAMPRFLEIMKFAAENDLLTQLVDRLEYLNNYSNGDDGAYPINQGKNTCVTLQNSAKVMSMIVRVECCDAWYKDPHLMQELGRSWEFWQMGEINYNGCLRPDRIDPQRHSWTVYL